MAGFDAIVVAGGGASRLVAALTGRAMRDLVSDLRAHDVPAQAEEAIDCDTWADVRWASMLLEGR
ncbi:MAG: hypothetical protein GEU93_05470 [Propionibacteriales bacterium]|nr:hypothetical protein [Propionibacteriales bacterium]